MNCENCHSGHYQTPKDSHPSYVECSACGAIKLTYVAQDYQEDMHQVNTGGDIDIISCFGGYGSGKSRSTLQEFLLRALENPRGTGLFAAQTLGQLKKTTLKTWFEEICPPPLIETYNKADGIIKMINGFTIFIVATDEEQKLRSLNLGLVHLEEISNIKKSIYTQLLSRMRDSNVKNKAVIVCSNPANTWIKDEFVDNEARKDPKHPQHENYNPYIRTFIWKTELNKYLPPNFIEMNTKGRPEWYKKKYFEGSFEYNSGMVYPTIGEAFIEPYQVTEKTDRFGIPKDWERVIGADFGIRNPTAVLFAAINPKTGEVIVYNEYYMPEKTLPQHAQALKPLINEIEAGLLRFMVIDPATKARTNPIEGKSVQSHFQEYGLYFQLGNNSIEYGLTKVNSYIDMRKLKIYRNCVSLIKELLGYVYPELDMDNAEENQDEKPIKANDHACDALRYMIARLPDDPELLKSASYTPPKSYSEYKNYDTIEYEEDNERSSVDDYMAYY
jgi:phage terminase large subunit